MVSSSKPWAIDVTDLTVAYRDKPVLWDVDLQVPPKVLLAIVGPNGAGKTTMIKAILNLVPATAGRVLVYGQPYAEQRHLVGYVPQRGSVDWDFPTDVLDVVTMGRYGTLGWVKRPGRAERERALEALHKVGMETFLHRQISQLSGGQQQRVFLARALVQDAEIYLMDEPFQGVDATTERAIIALLQELRSVGKTVLVCSPKRTCASRTAGACRSRATREHPRDDAGRDPAQPPLRLYPAHRGTRIRCARSDQRCPGNVRRFAQAEPLG
jgi:manganese/zinc/iron transport system ATP- binding protein